MTHAPFFHLLVALIIAFSTCERKEKPIVFFRKKGPDPFSGQSLYLINSLLQTPKDYNYCNVSDRCA